MPRLPIQPTRAATRDWIAATQQANQPVAP
jgi:hypothetical protein